jgi:hypothetical protein
MAKSTKTFSRPADRSYEAFCDWILGINSAITGNKNPTLGLTEEEARAKWQEFWAKAGPEKSL